MQLTKFRYYTFKDFIYYDTETQLKLFCPRQTMHLNYTKVGIIESKRQICNIEVLLHALQGEDERGLIKSHFPIFKLFLNSEFFSLQDYSAIAPSVSFLPLFYFSLLPISRPFLSLPSVPPPSLLQKDQIYFKISW